MIGRKLGNYEVVDKLGEGGMGEVWRARDARLNRTVAVKVLPAEFAGDPSRRARFEQEARALGALNHPNIVAIYDIGQSDGQAYIVSELVEGESLRKIIDRGPLTGRKLNDIAVQTAEAVAAAHALGIVHRDLKPENIMVTGSGSGSAGRVKVLDFGLAKQSAPTTGDTETLAMSSPGMVLGTAGYMSPEQVRGELTDARSDIFSLGCVFYELATGRRAFEGKSAVEVMSAILREDPPEMTAGAAPVPEVLESIVRRCLEKDPQQRFQSASDLAFALRSVGGPSTAQTTAVKAVPRTKPRRWLLPAIAVGVAALTFVAGYLLRGRFIPAASPLQFHRITFREGRVTAARFAPDGQQMIYAASWDGGPNHIYLATPGNPEARDLGVPESELLSVSSKGDIAFLVGPFSPDGRGTLARSSIAGGQTRELLENVYLADWSPDGSELAIVRRVGNSTTLEYPVGKVLSKFEGPVLSLRVSPDGQHVAFTSYAQGARIGLYLAGRDGSKVRNIGNISDQTSSLDASSLYWSRDGREIWYRSFNTSAQNTMYAMDMEGKVRVVARFPSQIRLFDVAADGRVLMSTESGRLGIRGLAPGDTVERDWSCLESSSLRGISDDGRLIVADVLGESAGAKGSVYLRRTDGTPPVRLGDGAATVLSPDGKWISGFSSRETARKIFVVTPTGPGEVQPPNGHGIVVGWLSGDHTYLLAVHPKGTGRYQFFAWDAQTDQLRAASPVGMPDQLPLVSPDRRSYIAIGPDRQTGVYSVETGTGQPIKGLTEHDNVINWRADGRALYISTHHDMNQMRPVSLLDLATGQRTLWKTIQPAIMVDEVSNVHVTPDGKAYAYNYRYVRSELYVAEGIK